MTAREYLTQIRNMATRVRFLQDELERLRTDAASVSINLDGMPKVGGKGDKLERLAIKLAEYDDELQTELTALLNEKQRAVRLIAQIPKPKQQTLLTERYIHAKKWEQIAYEMDITWRYCYRLHGKALAAFDEVLKDDTKNN